MYWLERHWYRVTPLHLMLLPVSLLFRVLVALRRLLYRAKLLPATKLPVPVIVVGNITAGGSGKTPLTLWLAAFLLKHGRHPGIIARGYGGRAGAPMTVSADTDPALAGDEAVLLAKRSACPVWVGRDRVAAGAALLRAHPQCDMLVSDDGLQHYRLARDIEIAVVDGGRRFGNGFFLPAGPLRESVSRLDGVDAVVINGSGIQDSGFRIRRNCYRMRLVGDTFYNLLNPDMSAGPTTFRDKRLHAVAGIGNPQRFFGHLQELGLAGVFHAFPDHHRYAAKDLQFGGADAVLMTEKDAVKCASFASERCWVLAVDADADPALGKLILAKLEQEKPHGSEAA